MAYEFGFYEIIVILDLVSEFVVINLWSQFKLILEWSPYTCLFDEP